MRRIPAYPSSVRGMGGLDKVRMLALRLKSEGASLEDVLTAVRDMGPQARGTVFGEGLTKPDSPFTVEPRIDRWLEKARKRRERAVIISNPENVRGVASRYMSGARGGRCLGNG